MKSIFISYEQPFGPAEKNSQGDEEKKKKEKVEKMEKMEKMITMMEKKRR